MLTVAAFPRIVRNYFFCNAFSVLIFEHERHNADFTMLQKLSIHSPKSDICSHCTVSCDNKLLVCCIANEILIYFVDDPDRFCIVPHNHALGPSTIL